MCLHPVKRTPQSSPLAQGSSHHQLHSGPGAVLQPPALLSKALFLCRCLSVGTYVPGPGFIRSVVAPRSPWLVITQTCDVTALSQNLNTWGPHGLTWTSSRFHTCHINAQTDKLCMQEKTLTDRWVHANIKTHTSSCTYTDSSQGPCLCYKNIHWTESLLSSP